MKKQNTLQKHFDLQKVHTLYNLGKKTERAF